MLRSLFLALVSCTVALGQALTSAPPVLPTGSKAPDFDLPGIDGKRHQLKDFAAAKILVVVFTSNHCPEARAAAPRMAEMHARYADKG
ncbi:MAG TPA: redoxin domain-containing protein, partial [Luteolibacter sp.]|nr:redoxin domain-containing protein [Luteolibacter sp.]